MTTDLQPELINSINSRNFGKATYFRRFRRLIRDMGDGTPMYRYIKPAALAVFVHMTCVVPMAYVASRRGAAPPLEKIPITLLGIEPIITHLSKKIGIIKKCRWGIKEGEIGSHYSKGKLYPHCTPLTLRA